MAEPGPDEIERPIGLVITSVIECSLALAWAFRASAALEQFEVVFRGFGADLPLITRLVLKSAWLWWPLALTGAAIAVWIAMHARISRLEFRRMKLALRVYGLVLGISVATLVYALYAPIFKLGAVV